METKGGKMKKLRAFTLAEVLITLGVIGVVAAMTLPSVINHYQKQATALKVKKFYNMMNNAINRSIVDNGDVNTWYPERKNNTYNDNVNFLKTYILPYIKYDRYTKEQSTNRVIVYLTDGTYFTFMTDNNGTDIVYFINGKNEINPRNKFAFAFNKIDTENTTFIEPYTVQWNKKYETLKSHNYFACKKGCTSCGYCTKILQLNDWKFPDDYPW